MKLRNSISANIRFNFVIAATSIFLAQNIVLASEQVPKFSGKDLSLHGFTRSKDNKSTKISPALQEAYSYIEKKDYKKAIDLLSKNIKDDKSGIQELRYLIYCLLMTGQNDLAKENMLDLFKLEKPNAFDWYLIGQYHLNTGNNETAKLAFNNSLYYAPSLYLARFNMIRLDVINNDYEAALENIDEGSKLTKNAYLLRYYSELKKFVEKSKAGNSNKTNSNNDSASNINNTSINNDNASKVNQSAPVNTVKSEEQPKAEVAQPKIDNNSTPLPKPTNVVPPKKLPANFKNIPLKQFKKTSDN